MITRTEPTYTVDIFMAGDIGQAKQVCREFCYAEGFCIHIHPVDYVYAGGEEVGFKVGCLNYPRFPSKPSKLYEKAERLANALLDRLCQHSVLLVSPDRTAWITRREQ